ncbi:hypothetical protein [Rathayibacter rathayi]|nr:hypothetical protein [Rathayibacter rathayi]
MTATTDLAACFHNLRIRDRPVRKVALLLIVAGCFSVLTTIGLAIVSI